MVSPQTSQPRLESEVKFAQPELLISAALHLMSHYTANLDENGPCVKLAAVIERHLKALAEMDSVSPVIQATCQQLAEQWAMVVERAMPQPVKPALFAKLIAGKRAS